MEKEEHPVQQPINCIIISQDANGDNCDFYSVGRSGVTRIEAANKAGMYSNLPYLRVWAGETCVAEFCQHGIVGVYFEKPRENER